MNQISLLNWMLLSTVLLGVWWACYWVALHQERSFAYNRAFLVLGPLLAAGLPLLPLAWPTGWWGIGPAGLPGMVTVLLPTAQIRPGVPGAAVEQVDWSFWLLTAYLFGAALTLLRLAIELGRLWWQARGLPRTAAEGYTLVETHGRLPTSSFGRVIFWDETLALSPAEARQVLRHELAHVRQHHTADRLLLELLRAALWFNPFVHLCARALGLIHEYMADEAALKYDNSSLTPSRSTSYSQLLARQVASRLGFSVPLAHSFSHSQTLRRIAMIQKTSPICRWKQWLVLPLLGILLIAVACEKAASPAEPALSKASADAQMAPPPPKPIPADATHPAPPLPPGVYVYVEHMPQLASGGGNAAIVEFIQKHVAYPQVAAADQRSGRVFVSFIVDSEGGVQAPAIVKGLSPAYDEAVLAAVRQLPRFAPGKQNDKAVPVVFTVPILFTKATAPSDK